MNVPVEEFALQMVDGIRFSSGPESWSIEPTKVEVGTWVAFVPDTDDLVTNPSAALVRIFNTMAEPIRGSVELMGHDVYKLDYGRRQRLRARIGFVPGYGGLLSNRTVRDNLQLPVSVHGGMIAPEEELLVDSTLNAFSLLPVADLLPHEMDGGTRWRACLARALVLRPDWLVMEGLGNWEMDRGRGVGWKRLVAIQQEGKMAVAICLPRQNPGFESWFEEHDGIIVRYARLEGAADGGR